MEKSKKSDTERSEDEADLVYGSKSLSPIGNLAGYKASEDAGQNHATSADGTRKRPGVAPRAEQLVHYQGYDRENTDATALAEDEEPKVPS